MRYLVLPLLALGLSSCAMFQSNVKGGFSCGAARGTCAPSTAIDDGAIHAIDTHKADTDAPSRTEPSPDDPKPRAASADADSVSGRGALKVVYPAWRDGSGHVHKRTVAYVNVDAPGLVAAVGAPHASDNPTGTNLLAIAEAAPDLTLVSPTPALAPAHDAPVEPRVPASNGPTPIGAIQAQVRDILAKAPKPTIKATAPTPLSPAQDVQAVSARALPATTGGTLPPQGE